jgi:hypothetical protein
MDVFYFCSYATSGRVKPELNLVGGRAAYRIGFSPQAGGNNGDLGRIIIWRRL